MLLVNSAHINPYYPFHSKNIFFLVNLNKSQVVADIIDFQGIKIAHKMAAC